MASSRFVYVTYIRTTPKALWEAITKSEWTRQYYYGADVEAVHDMASKSYEIARRSDDSTVMMVAIQGMLRAEYMLGNLKAVETFPSELDLEAIAAVTPDQMVTLGSWEDTLDGVRRAGRREGRQIRRRDAWWVSGRIRPGSRRRRERDERADGRSPASDSGRADVDGSHLQRAQARNGRR